MASVQEILKFRRRIDLLLICVAVTLFCIVASVVLTVLIVKLQGVELPGQSIWISVLVPLVVAPICSYFFGRIMRKVEHLKERLRILSENDELTGLRNRRAFIAAQADWLASAATPETSGYLLLLDVDHFKRINDGFGHFAGDLALAHVGERLTKLIPTNLGLPGRWGGEEFAVVIRVSDAEAALDVAELIRRDLAGSEIPTPAGIIRLTVSLGVAAIPRADGLFTAFQAADAALYRAKAQGRNRAILA